MTAGIAAPRPAAVAIYDEGEAVELLKRAGAAMPGNAAFTLPAASSTFADGATWIPMNTDRRPVKATLKS